MGLVLSCMQSTRSLGMGHRGPGALLSPKDTLQGKWGRMLCSLLPWKSNRAKEKGSSSSRSPSSPLTPGLRLKAAASAAVPGLCTKASAEPPLLGLALGLR